MGHIRGEDQPWPDRPGPDEPGPCAPGGAAAAGSEPGEREGPGGWQEPAASAGAACLRGVAHSLLVVAAVVVVGLGGAWGLREASRGAAGACLWGDAAAPGCDLPGMDERPGEAPRQRWLVDGFNVLHVAILQGRSRGAWWRGEGRRQLLERAGRFAEPDAEVWVVFDGPRAPADAPEGRPRVVFAPSADAWLLREVGAAPEPGRLTVVTADRSLADRARHRGAQVVSPREFLERCG